MNHFWKNIASFTKRERRGAFLMILILFAIIGTKQFIPKITQLNTIYSVSDSTQIKQWLSALQQRSELDLRKFNPNEVSVKELSEMGIPASLATGWVKYLDAGGRFYQKSDVRKIYGMADTLYARLEPYIQLPRKKRRNYAYQESTYKKSKVSSTLKKFNPNEDSKQQLFKSGLQVQVVENIVNYRNAGGTFQQKEDVLKLYALDREYYKEIESFIQLPKEPKQVVKVDSVELNSATVEELEQLSINKLLASRIINYRDMLGGFYSHKQLHEVYNIDRYTINILQRSSWIDTLLITPIEVNKVKEFNLSRHPYISRKAAEQIRKYRDFASEIKNFKELSKLGIIEGNSEEKLRYYLMF